MTAETWRVRHPDGSIGAVTVTKLDNGQWRAETSKGYSWSVRPSARDAVVCLFDVSPDDVFGPGETPEERAAFTRGVEAMRAAAVAVCRETAKASTRSELAMEQRIQFAVIAPEATK